jgi:hypothetical protein
MLGSGNTGAVRAFVTASSARSQDADLYSRYAVRLYRQALHTYGGPPLPEPVVGDVIVNEAALARIAERGEDDARYRLTESVLRRCQQLAARAVAIYPRDMAALLHAVMRRPASSSVAVAEDGSQARTPAVGRQPARRREAELTACSGMRDISAAVRCRGPADKREENDANSRMRYDDHHGRRRGGAWAGGGQIAARCAAVPDDDENVVKQITLLRTPAAAPAKHWWLRGRARSFFRYTQQARTPSTEPLWQADLAYKAPIADLAVTSPPKPHPASRHDPSPRAASHIRHRP